MNEHIFKIIDLAITSRNKTEIIQEVKKWALELRSNGDYKTANYLFNLIGMNNDKIFIAANDNYESKILEKRNDIAKLELFPPDLDVENLISVLNDNEKIKKIGPFKCLITGRPGTGKTSMIYYIAQKISKDLFYLKASNLVSYLLGETQKNVELLKEDIMHLHKNSIILIDEFDSIIGNRKENMNNEYKRLIGDFNLMLDDLPKDTIIFAISNMIDLIDDATRRRFNVLIEMNNVNSNVFIQYLKNSCDSLNIKLDYKLVEKIISKLKNSSEKLNFSQINNIVNDNYILKKNIYKSLLEHLNLSSNIKILKDEYKFSYNEIAKIVDQTDKTIKRRYGDGDY